jgi:hypothetical protein
VRSLSPSLSPAAPSPPVTLWARVLTKDGSRAAWTTPEEAPAPHLGCTVAGRPTPLPTGTSPARIGRMPPDADGPDERSLGLITRSLALLQQSRAHIDSSRHEIADTKGRLDRARNVLQAVFLRRALRRGKGE